MRRLLVRLSALIATFHKDVARRLGARSARRASMFAASQDASSITLALGITERKIYRVFRLARICMLLVLWYHRPLRT
jgi:hypothetical protein